AEIVGMRAGCDDGAGVGTDGEETRNAEVEQAGQTPLHVQCQCQNRVDTGEREEKYRVIDETGNIHYSVPLKSPPGRKISTSNMMPNATAGWYAGEITSVEYCMAILMMNAPRMAP